MALPLRLAVLFALGGAVLAQEPPPPAVVALLDTGVDASHPALAGALLPGINAVEPGKPAEDADGHGTVLAGLIVGRSEKPEVRGWAADFPVRVLPIKVTVDGLAESRTLVSAIDAAIRAKASVICLTVTSPASTEALDAALDRACAAGVLVVAPAGNVHEDFGGFDSEPAAHPWVISCTSSRESPLPLPDGKGVAAGLARGERTVAGCAATGETELMLPGDATPLPVKGVPERVSGLCVSCARAAALAAILRFSRPDLTAVRAREILVSAGGLPESPDEQATERLRRGSREGVLRWAAKHDGPDGDLAIAAVHRAFAPGGALRLQVEVGNIGGAPLAGRVEVVPAGVGTVISREFATVAPAGRTAVALDLQAANFDAVALVRVVADGDINQENDVTRVVCFPPAETGIEIHRLRLSGRREGSRRATAGARLRNLATEAREVEVTAGIGDSSGQDTVTIPGGGFVDVALEFDMPSESDLTEEPFIISVTSGKARVALAGAMVELGKAEFVPRLDRPDHKRSIRR